MRQERWITIEAERALIVDRGRDVVLLDRLPSPVTLVLKLAKRAKHDRAMQRLQRGDMLYRLPSGQWKFGSNKFVPDDVVRRLPIELHHVGNDGREAFTLKPEYREVRP